MFQSLFLLDVIFNFIFRRRIIYEKNRFQSLFLLDVIFNLKKANEKSGSYLFSFNPYFYWMLFLIFIKS